MTIQARGTRTPRGSSDQGRSSLPQHPALNGRAVPGDNKDPLPAGAATACGSLCEYDHSLLCGGA